MTCFLSECVDFLFTSYTIYVIYSYFIQISVRKKLKKNEVNKNRLEKMYFYHNLNNEP